eukprot:UN00569
MKSSHPEALKIHGLDQKFLSKQRSIKRVMRSFLTFIQKSQLVAHNAAFHLRMLNQKIEK